MIFPDKVTHTEPLQEPVSLQTLKDHLRITHDEEDALLALYIVAAREAVESFANHAIGPKVYTATFDKAPADGKVSLWPGPVVGKAKLGEVELETYTNFAVIPSSITAPFSVTYTAGNAARKIEVSAIVLMAASLYENRIPVDATSLAEIPFSLRSLLTALRVPVAKY